MPKFILTRAAAERIVEAGTRKVYSNLQKTGKPSRLRIRAAKVYVKNNSSNLIEEGGIVQIDGLTREYSEAELVHEFQTKGVVVNGIDYDEDSALHLYAIAKKDICQSLTGECDFGDCFGSMVTIKSDSHLFATYDEGSLVSAPYGQFYLIGKSKRPTGVSSESDYDGFAILKSNEMGGHLVGTLQATITGSGTDSVVVGDITFTGIGCPLLRENESITAGSVVILSWNAFDNKLEIIESQCDITAEEEGAEE